MRSDKIDGDNKNLNLVFLNSEMGNCLVNTHY